MDSINSSGHIRKFTGRVVNGRGLGTYRMLTLQEFFSKHNLEIFPGTLNVVLKTPVQFNKDRCANNYRNQFFFWPITVNGISCLVYRWSQCPMHILEIVATTKLRDRFSGEDVTIEIEASLLQKLTATNLYLWNLSWNGREKLYYRDSIYTNLLGKFQNSTFRLKRFFGIKK